jgi:hypothetical protein
MLPRQSQPNHGLAGAKTEGSRYPIIFADAHDRKWPLPAVAHAAHSAAAIRDTADHQLSALMLFWPCGARLDFVTPITAGDSLPGPGKSLPWRGKFPVPRESFPCPRTAGNLPQPAGITASTVSRIAKSAPILKKKSLPKGIRGPQPIRYHRARANRGITQASHWRPGRLRPTSWFPCRSTA